MSPELTGGHTAWICAGSNIGDKRGHCENGIQALVREGETRLVTTSPCYMTEPVDYTDQDWFINMAVKIETRLDPLDLLDRLKAIEREAGRRGDTVRFGPRVLDLDIILYDDQVIQHDRLAIPHPRMHARRFVLEPLCDIDPDKVHPVLKRTLRQLLDDLDDDTQQVVPCS